MDLTKLSTLVSVLERLQAAQHKAGGNTYAYDAPQREVLKAIELELKTSEQDENGPPF